ncbi:MAG: DUF6473 family protein [Vicinamibacteraceae bacterium]
MTAEYAEPDWDVVDYHIYCLDPEVRDRQTGAALLLRGPVPRTLEAGRYFVSIGAAQTFGRFCEAPFPTLLQARLGLESVNLGRGGAGPSFFSKENGKLLEYVNGARFAIVQVMAGRSASNSLFESKGLGYYIRRSDGTGIGCDEAFTEVLASHDVAHIMQVVAETRQDWLASNVELLEAITVPKILLWLSERRPDYREGYADLNALFGRFPQLVNADMIRQLRRYSDDYVECVSTKGLPQVLINHFTGAPTAVRDPWGGAWTKNWYYPSPAMHVGAANALERVARRYVAPGGRHRRLKSLWGAGRELLASRLRGRH